MDASPPDPDRGIDEWVAEARHICLDNLRRRGIGSQRATLKERLFPLSSSKRLGLGEIFYSESAWAAGTLMICYLTFLLLTGNPLSALAFVLVASVVILPVLIIWAVLGFYYLRKINRKPLDQFVQSAHGLGTGPKADDQYDV